MYKTTINAPDVTSKPSSRTSKMGDLMVIIETNSNYKGHVILHSYDEFIDLNDPHNVWSLGLGVEVRYLKPGESVTLTVGED